MDMILRGRYSKPLCLGKGARSLLISWQVEAAPQHPFLKFLFYSSWPELLSVASFLGSAEDVVRGLTWAQ